MNKSGTLAGTSAVARLLNYLLQLQKGRCRMKVKFYGVRGSIASAGEETRRYGGNTPCVTVSAEGRLLVFDAGTGIRKLGSELLGKKVKADLFFSHLHWDHIQGFPFFTPAFVPGNAFSIHAVKMPPAPGLDAPEIERVLGAQMRAPNFPVGLDMMKAQLKFIDVPLGERIFRGGIEIQHLPVDHPNGCVAYRVNHRGRSVVYATDLEHHGDDIDAGLSELCQNADLLIYDAMYTPEEYDGKTGGMPRHGWGHSTFTAAARLARHAGVKELCLFHHDPAHDDAFLDDLAQRSRGEFKNSFVAREGQEIQL
jgi:phosphoribosyl 1,2-cyclic phosphodiesterase